MLKGKGGGGNVGRKCSKGGGARGYEANIPMARTGWEWGGRGGGQGHGRLNGVGYTDRKYCHALVHCSQNALVPVT